MPHTVSYAIRDKLREEIEIWLATRRDPSIPKAFTDALRATLTALEYKDSTLVDSRVTQAMEAFADVVNEEVGKYLGWPSMARSAIRRIWDLLGQNPSENWDEEGAEIESRLSESLSTLANLRDGAVKLCQDSGHALANATQLESAIHDLEKLKKGVLENWPWSTQELPPVNREMVTASMAAIARGEKGEPIQDLIRRLGGDPTRD